MYNSNKNKYLVYIMAVSDNFKTAISNAYKHLKKTGSENDFTVDIQDKILKESDIIKILIDKLNEKSPGAPDAGADVDVDVDGEAGTNNKIAISITKYNYGYYLNTIEDKEYALFLKLFLDIITGYSTYNENNIVSILSYNIYLFRYIKLIYKIYKKNIIHINNNTNNTIYNIFYDIYLKLHNIESYNYTIDYLNTINNEYIQYYNDSCKILLTFSSIIKIDIDNNNLTIYKNNDIELDKQFEDSTMTNKNPILFLLSNIFLKFNNFNYTKIFGMVKKIFSNNYINNFSITDDSIITDSININNNLSILKKYYEQEGNYLKKALDELKEFETKTDETNTDEINKIIESLYEPYPEYDYLIINKDKDIIDIFKENPEIEDNYNIDNNSLELVEISKDKINFNKNTYKLIGYIDENDEYTDIGDGGKGDGGGGGKDDEGGGEGGGDGGKDSGAGAAGEGAAGEDSDSVVDKTKKQNYNCKLLIYKKDKKKEKEEIITKLKDKYTPICDNINLDWSNQSCYIDSLLVALFNKKHKKMDDIIYNLDISNNFLLNIKESYDHTNKSVDPDLSNKKFIITYDYIINDNDKNELFYCRSFIKKHLIYLYDTISNNKKFSTAKYNLNNFRKSIQNYITYHNNITVIDYNNFKAKVINNETAETADTADTDEKYNDVDDNDKYKKLLLSNKKKSLKLISNNNDWTEDRQQDYKDLFNALNEIFNKSININFITQTYNETDELILDENYISALLHENNISSSSSNSIFINFFRINVKETTKNNFILNPLIEFQNNNKNYNLQSIILHSGNDHNSGHYTCIFKCNDKWYLYNDMNNPKVSIIETDGDFNQITNEQKQQIVGLYYI